MMKRCAIFCLTILILLLGEKVFAKEGFDYSFLEYSPDGMAWTVREKLPNPGDANNHTNPSCWYPDGETILVGNRSEQIAPGVGEHTYSYKRQGTVNVYKWVVKHSPARCIHNTVGSFHGVSTGSGKCRASYYSGWKAYCADCGEIISPFLIYLSKSKVKEIKTIDLDLDYYYLCPTCEHLEQGVRMEHFCTGISANRYQVKYLPGAGNVAGTMYPSYHVYNNSEVYEGQPITPNDRLSLNTYSRKGYLFAGWNTLPDGSGEPYEDGQEILNLSEENYDAKTGKGIVCLYAQWIKVTGTLFIDPGKGTYLGKGGITQTSVGYGDSLHLAAEYVVAPKGLRVHFETNGGKPLEDVVSSMSFHCWHMENPCHGVLQGEDYTFYGEDGDTDLVKAQYQALPISLPMPKREGYSFGGWYLDPSFQKLAGMENDPYTPTEDLTLYAYWVDLRLNAVLNLNCHDGKGAVDLSWQQKDKRNKRYQIFQKREGEEFHEISGLVSELVTASDCHFSHTGEEEVFVIENSGFYELEVKGAQGQGALDHQGGLGGVVSGKFYFEKGEKLRISVGGQNGYGGGGQGDNQAFGGGSSRVTSSTRGLLLVAGGGGGASPGADGGAGGLEDGLRADHGVNGESGDAGGGGGYIGGMAGTYRPHVHTEECYHVHQGDEVNGGPCYDEYVEEVKTCHVVVKGPFIDWGKYEDCLGCIAAGKDGHGTVHAICWRIVHEDCGKETDYGNSGWWECLICGHIGYTWGSGRSRPNVQDHEYTIGRYVLTCDQVYDCGNPDPVILPSHGGSNYVNEEYALTHSSKAGAQSGDGGVFLRPISVGFVDQCELKEVFAPDLAAPKGIDANKVILKAQGDHDVRVCFEKPSDLGTLYYHQVKSYLTGQENLLSASNVTCTNVVSGIAGYYYVVDDRKNTAVTRHNADNPEHPVTRPEILISVEGEKESYLHVAPVDVAGNVGESMTIRISQREIEVAWDLRTTPIEVSSNASGQEYGSVWQAEEGTYYVKADGTTPFFLSFCGEMTGPARENYQIDQILFQYSLADGYGEGKQLSHLLHDELVGAEIEVATTRMKNMALGREILRSAMYQRVIRKNALRELQVTKAFTMDGIYHGKRIAVMPTVGASFEEAVHYSDETLDRGNGVVLLGDGEAPIVRGWDSLEGAFQNLYVGEAVVCMELSAEDAHSGLRDFWLEVYQTNTGESSVFYADAQGRLQISLSENEEIFSGDVTLVAKARDHVGNTAVLEFTTKEFELRTEIVRILAPHEPNFKRGESGILRITVRGYAEALEITFPEEFSATNPGVNQVIRYEVPREVVTEEIRFMVPLELEEDGTFFVTVRAYKGSEVLEGRPELCTVNVFGSILGELRTRLR